MDDDNSSIPVRITCVIHALHGGGAERVIAAMANHWAANGKTVTLITLSDRASDAFELSADVHRVALGLLGVSRTPMRGAWNNVIRIRRLRQALRESRPDVIVSFTDKTNVLTLWAAKPLGVRAVIAERIDPRRHPLGAIWESLRRRTYPQADVLVVQTERVKTYCMRWLPDKKIAVIPNFVDPPANRSADASTRRDGESGRRRVIAVGRLARQKGFDLLVEAFARIADRHPQWDLEILGEGPERESLARQIHDARLADRVQLTGWIDNSVERVLQSDLFVLSSRYEGFPNALLEAMSGGLPVISFDSESGPAEIIRHNIDGILVPTEDVAALAEGLHRLMSDESLRSQLAKRAREVTERFSRDKYFERWEEVLRGLH